MKDYKKSIIVNSSPAEVYTAITTQITHWWSDDFVGAAAQKGDQYDIAFGNTKKTFGIVEADPNHQVIWLCLKAYIDMEGLKKKDEWAGTRIIWTILPNENGTTIIMLHEGLHENVECYNICVPAWDYFMASIQSFLTTGNGTPYRKKVGNFSDI
jgi:hypothetical protein